MIPNPFTSSLAELISNFREPDAIIRSRIQDIHEEVLRRSANIRQPNFASIHRHDLSFYLKPMTHGSSTAVAGWPRAGAGFAFGCPGE